MHFSFAPHPLEFIWRGWCPETGTANRRVDFKTIAAAAEIPENEVELLVMKALSKKLVKGTINQIDQIVDFTWVQPRVLDITQVCPAPCDVCLHALVCPCHNQSPCHSLVLTLLACQCWIVPLVACKHAGKIGRLATCCREGKRPHHNWRTGAD